MSAVLAGLGISRLEAELIGFFIVLAAGLMWLGFHDAAIKREATAPIIAQVQAVSDAASAAEAIHEVKVDAKQQVNLDAAQATIQAQQSTIHDLHGAVADAFSLRDDALRRAAAASHQAASAPGQAGGDAGTWMVPGQLWISALGAHAEAESDAADLAGYVAGLRVSGSLCVADHEALSP